MELNREEIIKALEVCVTDSISCTSCPLEDYSPCSNIIVDNALALIKELIGENERLHASCTELTRRTQDNVRSDNEELRKSNECDVRKLIADTVRKMQERINAHFDSDSVYFRNSHGYVRSVVDQIAKEMLEG